jgi:hypothetical protein
MIIDIIVSAVDLTFTIATVTVVTGIACVVIMIVDGIIIIIITTIIIIINNESMSQ